MSETLDIIVKENGAAEATEAVQGIGTAATGAGAAVDAASSKAAQGIRDIGAAAGEAGNQVDTLAGGAESIQGVGNAADEAGTKMEDFGGSAHSASGGVASIASASEEAVASTASLVEGMDAVAVILASLGISATIASMVDMADAIQTLTDRMGLLKDGAGGVEGAMSAIRGISLSTHSALTDNAEMYIKLRIAGESMNLTQQQTISLTRIMAEEMSASGKSAGEVGGAVRALTLAMETGATSGVTLTRVFNQFPLLAKLVANNIAGVNGNLGVLKEGIKSAAINIPMVIDAMLKGEQEAARANAAIGLTVGGAFKDLTTQLELYISEADKATGITGLMAASIELIGANIGNIAPFVIEVSVALASYAIYMTAAKLATVAFSGSFAGVVILITAVAAAFQLLPEPINRITAGMIVLAALWSRFGLTLIPIVAGMAAVSAAFLTGAAASAGLSYAWDVLFHGVETANANFKMLTDGVLAAKDKLLSMVPTADSLTAAVKRETEALTESANAHARAAGAAAQSGQAYTQLGAAAGAAGDAHVKASTGIKTFDNALDSMHTAAAAENLDKYGNALIVLGGRMTSTSTLTKDDAAGLEKLRQILQGSAQEASSAGTGVGGLASNLGKLTSTVTTVNGGVTDVTTTMHNLAGEVTGVTEKITILSAGLQTVTEKSGITADAMRTVSTTVSDTTQQLGALTNTETTVSGNMTRVTESVREADGSMHVMKETITELNNGIKTVSEYAADADGKLQLVKTSIDNTGEAAANAAEKLKDMGSAGKEAASAGQSAGGGGGLADFLGGNAAQGGNFLNGKGGNASVTPNQDPEAQQLIALWDNEYGAGNYTYDYGNYGEPRLTSINGHPVPHGKGVFVGYHNAFMATGGEFTVGGHGGTDTTPVHFMATPGEVVNVSTPAQHAMNGMRHATMGQRSGYADGGAFTVPPSGKSGGDTHVHMTVHAQDAGSFQRSHRQITAQLASGLARVQYRGGIG